ncbi:hypothetical protein ACLB1E_33010 [Escherichia coli]
MAEKFIKHTGLVVPAGCRQCRYRCNHPETVFAESDPYRFCAHLFNDWRFLDEKGQQPNPDFVLNFPQYQGASILLARKTSAAGSAPARALGIY